MASEKELFAAVRLIKEHCQEQDKFNPNSCVRDDYKCPLWSLCFITLGVPPTNWPDPEKRGYYTLLVRSPNKIREATTIMPAEGGGEDG